MVSSKQVKDARARFIYEYSTYSTNLIKWLINLKVEMNPIWQQKKLREFCKANNILITAYSPLGANGTPWGSSGVFDTQVLHEIAKSRGKTHAQVRIFFSSKS